MSKHTQGPTEPSRIGAARTIIRGSDSVLVTERDRMRLYAINGQHLGTFTDPRSALAVLDALDLAA